MANERALKALPSGLQVGDWRVAERVGAGTYGVVYRVLPVGPESTDPGALKLSVYPWDPRFVREAELLDRLRHASVPRLLGRGVLRHASGVEHPYLILEWIDGTPLYAWAERHTPSSRQVCQLLSQVARALAATHDAHAVHRDVKGGNILVRHSDGRAFLIDFGSGHFQGATRLTWQSLPPGTSAYRSPEACRFLRDSVGDRDAHYAAPPADDVFALGVTAYRLVMGEYPPSMETRADEARAWRLENPDPRLRALILRMLSESPEARGTAAELAEALEAVAEERLPERSRARVRRRQSWLALAAVGLSALLLWTVQAVSTRGQENADAELPDAGTAAVGDSLLTTPAAAHPSAERKPVAQPVPLAPRPGQTRPDGKGRCPGSTQVSINGGCWVEQPATTAEVCMENGYAYSKGKCYAPALELPDKPLPTSAPANAR
ncbi:serine/threonine-protein kinase [Hyalangium rubrum]|uniref:Serine/threonine-protein kinase n=1 Tax=Hyalangium rubrum TaxID=3103134 RepID=A0ABU5HA53_9BACT|nr:serine/threonine-protein kinase [Hyalangium sp. s54d21]MDY7230186.1 serine/threonine-protein kinase [Hyalangium sp. s54d21]